MDAQLSVLKLPDLVIQLIIWKFLEANIMPKDISNISLVCKEFRNIVFSKPFQHFLRLGVNTCIFPHLPITGVEFRFIEKLRSTGNEYATLLLAAQSFFFQNNYVSIQTFAELASGSSVHHDLAHYIYGIALLCFGDRIQGQTVLSSLSEKLHNQPEGQDAWKKCRHQIMSLLGRRTKYKVPQTMICSIVGSGHLNPSVNKVTIFRVKPTCPKCVAYVETTIIRAFAAKMNV